MLYKPKIMAPCYKCPDRWTDGTHRCHDSCQRYMAYKAEMEGVANNINPVNSQQPCEVIRGESQAD